MLTLMLAQVAIGLFVSDGCYESSLNQAQHRPLSLALQAIAVEARLRLVSKRLDAALQLGSALRVRSDSRPHRQRISLLYSENHFILPAVFPIARGLTHDTPRWIHRRRQTVRTLPVSGRQPTHRLLNTDISSLPTPQRGISISCKRAAVREVDQSALTQIVSRRSPGWRIVCSAAGLYRIAAP